MSPICRIFLVVVVCFEVLFLLFVATKLEQAILKKTAYFWTFSKVRGVSFLGSFRLV